MKRMNGGGGLPQSVRQAAPEKGAVSKYLETAPVPTSPARMRLHGSVFGHAACRL
jgi:hypothetical protein